MVSTCRRELARAHLPDLGGEAGGLATRCGSRRQKQVTAERCWKITERLHDVTRESKRVTSQTCTHTCACAEKQVLFTCTIKVVEKILMFRFKKIMFRITEIIYSLALCLDFICIREWSWALFMESTYTGSSNHNYRFVIISLKFSENFMFRKFRAIEKRVLYKTVKI